MKGDAGLLVDGEGVHLVADEVHFVPAAHLHQLQHCATKIMNLALIGKY